MSKPSDLVPELQGRFPIRVELHALSAADFERILTEPENALIRQYAALTQTEGCRLTFTGDAIGEIARMAYAVNQKMENIGARRLHTILTSLLEDILFDLPAENLRDVTIDRQTVTEKLAAIVADDDLARYIL
jgi:ATP-dependent HslUV protease ATP-binding subunit HslU